MDNYSINLVIQKIFLIYEKNILGFWKLSNNSTVLYECTPNIDSCVQINNEIDNICLPEYVGPLCQTCAIGFSKSGVNCMPCYSQSINYFVLIFIGVILIIVFSIYIKYNLLWLKYENKQDQLWIKFFPKKNSDSWQYKDFCELQSKHGNHKHSQFELERFGVKYVSIPSGLFRRSAELDFIRMSF